MKNGKNWALVDAIIGGVGAVLSIVGIFTSIKASSYNDEQADKRLEEKYGLTPVSEEES